MKKPDRPYSRVLIVFYESNYDFKNLDEATYDNHIQPTINTLEDYRYRKQLNKTFARNLGSDGTIIIKSSDFLQVNEEFTYEEFNKMLDNTSAEAILFVKLSGYWQTTQIVDGNSESSPNASFASYLYDLEKNETVWLSNTVVRGGTISGYDTINNTLARRIAKKLQREKYIHFQPYRKTPR